WRRRRRPGGTRPRPYFSMNSRSQTSHAGMVGTIVCERYMPITNSWYESFIDEATPRCVDRYETRLGSVERQMRENPAPATEPPGLGARRPERRRSTILLNRRADRARHPNAVPGRAGKRHGVRKRRPDIVVQPLNAAAKSTGRQHDPSTHCHAAGIAV